MIDRSESQLIATELRNRKPAPTAPGRRRKRAASAAVRGRTSSTVKQAVQR